MTGTSPIFEFLLRYGERAYQVLKAALEVSEEYVVSNKYLPGDFDSKGLLRKLKERGVRYNPTQLLRIMEREYGIIETTYRTSTQHWWSFLDKEAVVKALRMYEGGFNDEALEDPELMVLDIQVNVLEISRVISELKSLRSKSVITNIDRERFLNIVLNELPNIAKVVKKASKYPERYKDYILKFRLAIKLARDVALRLNKSATKRLSYNSSEPINTISVEVDDERPYP